ncbi:MAG: class I SAM-dependent methyltransferase [Euzebya sp.]
MTDAQGPIDRRAAGEFARTLVGHLSSSMTVTMLELGRRLGLLDALAGTSLSVEELARVTGCQPRYVTEWLGLMVSAGVLIHDEGHFGLSAEHAAALLGDSPYNISAMLSMATATAHSLDDLQRVFVEGGGIGYDQQHLDADDFIDRLTRNRYDALLVDSYLAQVPGLTDRLTEGARLLEFGCGKGHAARLIGQAFPASTVVGLDISDGAIESAREAVSAQGLDNVSFEVGSATQPPPGPWDLIAAFDVIHDLAHPFEALAAAHGALRSGGQLLMIDSGAPPSLAERAQLPWAPMMYGVSIAHCMTVSLAQGGEGLGTMWGSEAAIEALAAAGFDPVDAFELKGDPMDLLYVASKA